MLLKIYFMISTKVTKVKMSCIRNIERERIKYNKQRYSDRKLEK